MKLKVNLSQIVRCVVFSIILYIYIYNPYINRIGLASIRCIYPLFFLWACLHWKYVQRALYHFKNDIAFIALLFVYTFYWFTMGGDIVFVMNVLSIFIDGYLLSLFLYYLFEKGWCRQSIYKMLIFNAIFAAIISLLLFCMPDLNSFVRDNFSSMDTTASFLKFRGYGIACGLTFDYGIVQGLVLAFCLYFMSFSKNLILFPLLLISVLFNARIGAVAPLLILSYLLVKFRLKYWALLFSIVLVVIVFQTTTFYEDNMRTFLWITEGAYQLSDQLLGTSLSEVDTSTFDVLEDMYVWPQDMMGWLLGTGKDIYLDKIASTDIGYFIQLNYGGLVLCSLLLIGIFCLVKKIYNLKLRNDFYIFLFLTLILFISNYKGTIFNSNSLIRLYLLLYVFIVLRKNRECFFSNFKNPNKEMEVTI